eukprot:746353-Hanusia_phi.AAC.8
MGDHWRENRRKELEDLPVKALRGMVSNQVAKTCIEKTDFINCIIEEDLKNGCAARKQSVDDPYKRSREHDHDQPAFCSKDLKRPKEDDSVESMSLQFVSSFGRAADLKAFIRQHGGMIKGINEMDDLRKLAQEIVTEKYETRLKRKDEFERVHGLDISRQESCPICLDEMSSLLRNRPPIESFSDPLPVVYLNCCSTFYHSECLAQHILNSASDGRLPVACPTTSCGQKIRSKIIGSSLGEKELLQYNELVIKYKETHRGGAKWTGTQEEYDALYNSGMRQCPECGSWIEKAASTGV